VGSGSLTDSVSAPCPADVLFYGVGSAQTEKVVEFFLEREAAEAMIGEVREDEPLLADVLRVEAIELGQEGSSAASSSRDLRMIRSRSATNFASTGLLLTSNASSAFSSVTSRSSAFASRASATFARASASASRASARALRASRFRSPRLSSKDSPPHYGDFR
jgi:hypothetical protein